MGETPSKLFHAIVGLGLAAAGCGEVLGSPEDARAGEDATQGQQEDAGATTRPDAANGVDATPDVPMSSLADAARDTGMDAGKGDAAPDAFDAAHAEDAAMDVTRPPPPEIK